MEHWLTVASHYVALGIEAIAVLIIAISSLTAFLAGARFLFTDRVQGHDERSIWLRHARWLVAGLTFQLAADLIRSTIAPTWDDIGRLAAIAFIRTFLNFFLERDLAEVAKRQETDSSTRGV